MFELKLKSGIVPLKWGTWAMRRACELAGTKETPLPLEDFFGSLLGSAYDFRKIAIFLQAAAECAVRGPVEYTEFDFGDWVDECGGILAKDGPMIDFFQYVVNTTVNTVTPLPGEQNVEQTIDEKKNNVVEKS